MKVKLNSSDLAKVGITGMSAFVLMMIVVFVLLLLNLGVYALLGLVFAYLWNTFVVPNVGTHLPLLLWWQAGLLLLALRVFFSVVLPDKS